MGDGKENVLLLKVASVLDSFCSCVSEIVSEEIQQVEECKKKNELESRVAAELKLHEELRVCRERAVERLSSLDRLCVSLQRSLTIADSDRARLDNAKDAYQIAKELTGIRWDYSAPSDLARGYVKSERRKLLQPFELRADGDQLWAALGPQDDIV